MDLENANVENFSFLNVLFLFVLKICKCGTLRQNVH